MSIDDTKRRLVWHGMFLFLLGLLTGFVEPDFKNVRMALAAHLEGVMNGIFLIALGAVWNELRFSARQNVAAYGTALYGTYGNWAVTTLAAVFWDRCPFAHHVSRTTRPALAGKRYHRSLHERRGRDCRLRGPRALGRAPRYAILKTVDLS